MSASAWELFDAGSESVLVFRVGSGALSALPGQRVYLHFLAGDHACVARWLRELADRVERAPRFGEDRESK